MAVTTWRELLAASGWRPRILLSVLLYTGWAPTAKDFLTLKVNSVEAGKPCPRGKAHSEEMGGTPWIQLSHPEPPFLFRSLEVT